MHHARGDVNVAREVTLLVGLAEVGGRLRHHQSLEPAHKTRREDRYEIADEDTAEITVGVA